MSATDPNNPVPGMNMWLNPQIPGQPEQPAQMAQPAQPAQQPMQQPVPPVQQYFQNPATGQNDLYTLNPATNQWELAQPAQAPQQPVYGQQNTYPTPADIQAATQPQPQQPMQQQPMQPQPAPYQQPGMQPGMQQPNMPQPPQQPGQLTISQQMEQMRQSNANRTGGAGNGASLRMSLKGVQAGNFNLLDPSLVYEGKVTSSKLETTKDNSHEMIVLKLVVTFPEQYRGTMLRNNLNLIPESLGFYRSALEAADLFNYETEEPMLQSEEDFTGKILRFSISHQEYPKGSSTFRNNISGAFSKAFESAELQNPQGAIGLPFDMPQQSQQPQPFQPQPTQQQPFTAPQPAQQPQQPQQPMQSQQSAQPLPAQPPQGGFLPPAGYVPPPQSGQTGQSATGQPPQQPNFGTPQG